MPAEVPQPPQQNIDDLLSASMSAQPAVSTGDTLNALQDLNLGGKTSEEAVAEQQQIQEKIEEEEK